MKAPFIKGEGIFGGKEGGVNQGNMTRELGERVGGGLG